MPFKIKKLLTDRQLARVKFSTASVMLITVGSLMVSYYQQNYGVEAYDEIEWNGEKFSSIDVAQFETGRIVQLSKNTQVCHRYGVLFPGIPILPTGVLAVAYCIALIYLFAGIGIVSDIFMTSIEKITSQVTKIVVADESG